MPYYTAKEYCMPWLKNGKLINKFGDPILVRIRESPRN